MNPTLPCTILMWEFSECTAIAKSFTPKSSHTFGERELRAYAKLAATLGCHVQQSTQLFHTVILPTALQSYLVLRVYLFFNVVLHSPSWPQTCYVTKGDLEFKSFLFPPPECWLSGMQYLVLCGAGLNPGLYILDQHSTCTALAPKVADFYYLSLRKWALVTMLSHQD